MVRRAILEELNFYIIIFSNWECAHCITLNRTPIRDVGVTVKYKLVFRCSIVLSKISYGIKERANTVQTMANSERYRLSRQFDTVQTLADYQDGCRLSIQFQTGKVVANRVATNILVALVIFFFIISICRIYWICFDKKYMYCVIFDKLCNWLI